MVHLLQLDQNNIIEESQFRERNVEEFKTNLVFNRLNSFYRINSQSPFSQGVGKLLSAGPRSVFFLHNRVQMQLCNNCLISYLLTERKKDPKYCIRFADITTPLHSHL